ncbi:hypothetical protein [Pseudomonas taiwanensis]|uniref:NADPH:quinone reductase n=1 Tax=Pseudomonas taiwanensis TaxID=470150 RepID=A0ABR6VC48_9PSED|nr:hypothetical protein [Pseudomonas taiwanensis]MBC3478032.1 hypothetical protein [Pseudomonas taiwanensis]
MSRVVRLHELEGPEVLHVEYQPKPMPPVGEALVKVRAIEMNRADMMFRMDNYLDKAVLPSR